MGLLGRLGSHPEQHSLRRRHPHRRVYCEQIVAAARRGGRDNVGGILLGRGEDDKQVHAWLTTAAGVPGFIDFAVGRTAFWGPRVGWRARKTMREAAVAEIARRYWEMVCLLVLVLVAWGVRSVAVGQEVPNHSGTVTVTATSIAAGIGWTRGSGTLTLLDGSQHRVKVGGLDVVLVLALIIGLAPTAASRDARRILVDLLQAVQRRAVNLLV